MRNLPFLATFMFVAALAGRARADELDPTTAPSGPVGDQLAIDLTPVPTGMSAVFVPAVEGRGDGTPVSVLADGIEIAAGHVGERIVVPPGKYRVLVGDGPDSAKSALDATAVRDVTTTLIAPYGVIRVAVVDGDNEAVALAVRLTDVDRGTVYGPFDIAPKPGTRPSHAWSVPPGRYVLSIGDREANEPGGAAITVVAGQVVHLKATAEKDRIVGTGFGLPNEVEEAGPFTIHWTVGADFSLQHRESQTGTTNGLGLQLGGITRFEGALDTGSHLLQLDLFVDEAWMGLTSSEGASELPFQKMTDDAGAELTYNYRLFGVLGPYVHAGLRTSFFPTTFHAGSDILVRNVDRDGELIDTETFRDGSSTDLTDPLSPTIFQEGAGIGTKFESEHFRFALRGGFALRQGLFGGRYVREGTDTTLTLQRLGDEIGFGPEAMALVGLSVLEIVDVSTRLDAYVDRDQFETLADEFERYRPIFRWDTFATVDLGRYVTAVYGLSIKRDADAVAPIALNQSLRLRFQWAIF